MMSRRDHKLAIAAISRLIPLFSLLTCRLDGATGDSIFRLVHQHPLVGVLLGRLLLGLGHGR